MNIEPKPCDREVLAGLVERVTYHNAENGFCVLRAKARGHRDVVTVVGILIRMSIAPEGAEWRGGRPRTGGASRAPATTKSQRERRPRTATGQGLPPQGRVTAQHPTGRDCRGRAGAGSLNLRIVISRSA